MQTHCPSCKALPSASKHIVRNGTYTRKSDSQQLARFYCRKCKKYFSQATHHPCFGQKRRRLNHRIYQLLCSGVSMRRCAILLGCNQKTIARKLKFLATRCEYELKNHLQKREIVHDFQFDDVETFEHTKCKPVSITLAVETSSRMILGFAVSPIAAKGKLAKVAKKKYGFRKSGRKNARDYLLKYLADFTCDTPTITTDMDPHYPASIAKIFPNCTHQSTKGIRGCVTGQGELKATAFDPLFALNHTAAMLRANMNRLFRRTWCTTKTLDGLRAHLWLYTHFHNFKLLR